MSSFSLQARRVRDRGLPLGHRLSALRECTLRYALYGFRATWHHLSITARIPKRLDHDPESLERAVAELEPAREIWLEYRAHLAARRRHEKAGGRRVPHPGDLTPYGGRLMAYCPDPDRHPRSGLVHVTRTLIAAYEAGPIDPPRCLVCRTSRAATELCPACGVAPPAWRPDLGEREQARIDDRWRQIWRRTWATPYGFAIMDAGEPLPADPPGDYMIT
jgi:hypothetical protein